MSNDELEPRKSSLGHVPAKPRWEFDATVTAVFDDMLARSIPDYETMRDCCHDAAKTFVRASSLVLDLGCSRGDGIARLLAHVKEAGVQNVTFYGLDNSVQMAEACHARFRGDLNVQVTVSDLRTETLIRDAEGVASIVQSILTLQFVPIEHRQRIVGDVYRCLLPGGAFLLVEKVLGQDDPRNRYLVDRYYAMKERNGYSRVEIEAKRLALEGVLVPLKASWNEEMLRDAGFSVQRIWQCLNFVAWIAVKPS